MTAVRVWCWIAGEAKDCSLIIDKCPITETPPNGAWQANQSVGAWREEMLAELDQIDLESIRALRAGETDRLAALDARAVQLRGWLRSLNA